MLIHRPLVQLLKSLKRNVTFNSSEILVTTLSVSLFFLNFYCYSITVVCLFSPWVYLNGYNDNDPIRPQISSVSTFFHICVEFSLLPFLFFFLNQVSLSVAPMTLYFLFLRTLHYFLFPSARNRADLSSILRQFIFWLATFFPEGSSFIPLPGNRNSFLHLYIWLHLAS